MDRGRIVETGTGRDLFLQPKTAFAGRFFGRGAVLPGEKLSLPGHGLVFIPRDAIRRQAPSGSGALFFKAYFRRASFEGGVVNLELELENSARVSARLSAEQPIRAPLPEKDKLYTWELDRELIRFVE
jgi:ABC-type Fe3+/spermidine/putrescine transport system ATPase subunit